MRAEARHGTCRRRGGVAGRGAGGAGRAGGARPGQDLPDGRGRGAGAARCRPHAPRGRAGRAARPLGQREIHAAEHSRRARHAFGRRGAVPRPADRAGRRAGADPLPAPACRLRLPVLQPHRQPHRAGECRAGDRDRRGADGAGGGAGAGRPRRPARSFPRPALRRRTAAGGHRPRHRQVAGPAVLRRADRRARQPHRHSGARGDPEGERRTRHHHGAHHP